MKPLSPFSSFSSFFCFFLFLSLSFSSSTSYVSAAQVEIIVNNSTEFQNAFSTVISSPNYTTITINASLTCDFTFAVNKNFTLRSTPGRVYTITFAPLISVSLGGLSTSAVAYQTIQDLILTRPIGNNNNFFIAAYGVMNFINVVFRNVAGGSTKAVTLTSVTALFENCQFISNDCGRTLLLEDSPTTLTGCTFHNNSKAILAYDNFLDFIVTIHNCTFTNNWAVDELIYGGAITSWDIGMRISNSKFYNNIARNGGAIQFGANYLEPKNALQITNCQFDNNTAIEGGAAIYFVAELQNNNDQIYSLNIINSTFGSLHKCQNTDPPCSIVQLAEFYEDELPAILRVGIYRSFFDKIPGVNSLSLISTQQGVIYDSCLAGATNNPALQNTTVGPVTLVNYATGICGMTTLCVLVDSFCSLICPTSTTPLDCENFGKITSPSSSSNAGAAIGGAVGGGLLLLLVIVLLLHRRRNRGSSSEKSSKASSKESSESTVGNSVFNGTLKNKNKRESEVQMVNNEVDYSNELDHTPISNSNPYSTVVGVAVKDSSGNSDKNDKVDQLNSGPMVQFGGKKRHLIEDEKDRQGIYSELVLDDAAVRSSLVHVRDLGEGEFGQVFLAMVPAKQVYDAAPDIIPLNSGDDNSLAFVAVKQLKLGADERSRRDFASEISMMKHFKHPAIVRVIAALIEEEPFMLVLEFLPYSDLRTVLLQSVKANMPWSEAECVHVLRQIGSGLAYLADLHFVHRDMAARNCLVGPDLTAKISDFGLARELVDENDYYKIQTKGKLPLKWMAPESINYRKFSTASDVWSFGVVCWEVFSYGEHPFIDIPHDKLSMYLDQGGRLPCPPGCSDQVYQFLLRCWNRNPDERPTALFCSDFFKFLLPTQFAIRDMGKLVSSGGHSYVNVSK